MWRVERRRTGRVEERDGTYEGGEDVGMSKQRVGAGGRKWEGERGRQEGKGRRNTAAFMNGCWRWGRIRMRG